MESARTNRVAFCFIRAPFQRIPARVLPCAESARFCVENSLKPGKNTLKMPEWLLRLDRHFGWTPVGLALQRSSDQFLRSQADAQSKRENDSAKHDAEGDVHDA